MYFVRKFSSPLGEEVDPVDLVKNNQEKRSVTRKKNLTTKEREIEELVDRLVSICGVQSKTNTKTMKYRLGELLKLKSNPTIVVPVCPDYGHDGKKYTFNGLFGGVSLLTQKHIEFLDNVTPILPKSAVIFLLADHEADDPDLCRVVEKTREEFADLMLSSLFETRKEILSRGWFATFMTAFIPHLISDEESITKEILNDSSLGGWLRDDTESRRDMYRRINGGISFTEMTRRTAHTTAQYVALGRFATEARYLVCNHTTTNLAWYKRKTNVALLHNDVRVY